MSKYTTISNEEEDVELNAPRHGPSYRDDPPSSNSFDSQDSRHDEDEYDNNGYGDDDGEWGGSDDEEIAVQSHELGAASSRGGGGSSCKILKCLVLITLIAAWIGGSKYYIDQNGVPESVGGLWTRFKADLDEWRGNNDGGSDNNVGDDSVGEEEIRAFVEEETGEERTPLDYGQDTVVVEVLEDEVHQDSAEVPQDIEESTTDEVESVSEQEEEPIVDEAEPVTEQEKEPNIDEVESVSEQEEPNIDEVEPVSKQEEQLQEELVELVQEEAQNIAEQETEENTVVDEQPEQINLDYMVGATGKVSREWNAVEMVAHDSSSFTQGLSYGPDYIYETTGFYGSSKLRKIKPETFEVEQSVDIDGKYFGEGSTYYTDSQGNGRIIEITWREQTGFIYDADTLDLIKEFTYTTTAPGNEGWGITFNPTTNEFVVSDGSPYLYFWDAETLQEKRKVEVTRMLGSNTPQNMLNELEYMDGLICCNIWHVDEIICVNPEDGKSVREYDFQSLYPLSQRGGSENVLNGIALGTDHILITGKRWDRMFKVTLNDWPSLFANNNAVIAGVGSEPVQVEEPEQNDAAEQDTDNSVDNEVQEEFSNEEEGIQEDIVAGGEDVAEEAELEGDQAEVVDIAVQSQNAISTSYTVIEQVSHDKTSFTQGLSYGKNGAIYETTGLYDNSKLRKINPDTFDIEKSVDVSGRYFGEGSTFYVDKDGNNRIIEITWKSQTGFIYDADTLERLSTFVYKTTPSNHEGWGITYDEANQEFIVSDGSVYLYFWDRDTLQEKRHVMVTRFDGTPQNMLNELEFMDGLVCCNIWHRDDIICVDPTTGKSVREYDMSQLWPRNERGSSENVLNGIALGPGHVLITGKRWDRMYKINFDDWPTLFSNAQGNSVVPEATVQEEQSQASAEESGGEALESSTPSEDAVEEVASASNAMDSLSNAAEDLPDYFVPLTPDERTELKKRLRDTVFQTYMSLISSSNPSIDQSTLVPQRTFKINPDISKQFMHMHHMKTGGTSMDHLIHCAMERQLHVNNNSRVQYSSMSECGPGVRSCMDQLAKQLDASVIDNVFYYNDEEGKPNMNAPFDPAVGEFEEIVGDLNVCKTSDCGVMSYCASLHTVRTFGWKDVDKITVIRNPIDRAWSMYRFTLNSCYNCKELKDVLKEVASGTFEGGREGGFKGQKPTPHFQYDPSDSCSTQMIGHQATNLLSSIDLYNVANDVRFPREQEIVEEAVKNLRESFTWIGLTDRLEESVDGFRQVFPFLAENLTQAVLDMGEDFRARGHPLEDPAFSLPDDYVDTGSCPFPHENGGREPTCGTKEMDDETIKLILKLNNRDRAVYQAAVERFEIQQEVLQEYKSRV